MLSEPPRCRPVPVLALKGADSPRGLHRGHSPGHGSPQVLEAQGVVGRSRQVGPIRTAYDRAIRITMRGTGMSHATVSPSTMPVGRMPQTTKSTIMATSQGMPAPEDISLSD